MNNTLSSQVLKTTPLFRRRELARFLKAKRDALAPEILGFPKGRRRRTPGLKREEVASLAFVSVTWYSWLEQARDVRVSQDVLERIAKALRLSPSDSSYMFTLAGYTKKDEQKPKEEINAGIQRVLDGFQLAPVMVVNDRFDCLSCNSLAEFIFKWQGHGGPFGNNFLWRAFMDPSRRKLYTDWEEKVHQSVGLLRTSYASHVGDSEFESLIKELSENSNEFANYWNKQSTTSLAPATVTWMLPQYGPIQVHSLRMVCLGISNQTVLFFPAADEKALRAFETINAKIRLK